MNPLPLIVLRPEPGAATTVDAARARGLDAHACPLFMVVPLAWTPPPVGTFDALALTSANAVRHAGDALSLYAGLPVHAVGAATAEAARSIGLNVVRVEDKGAQALVDAIDPAQRILWLSGEDRTAIDPHGRGLTAVAVYAARAIDPPANFAALVSAPSVVLVHSVRAGERLAALVDERASIAVAAISAKAARACGSGWAHVAAAAQPNGDAVLALAGRMCQTSAGNDAAGRSRTGTR